MSGPDVSVVIAAHNAAGFIAESLDSVLAQTCAPAEIIVVDDGSTDSTRQVVASCISRGVLLVEHEANLGVSAAMNTAFALVKSEFIALLGHDDIWLPNKLERQLRLLDRADVDVCFTDYVEFGLDPQPGTGFGQRNAAMRRYPRRALGDACFEITSPSFLIDLVHIQATPMPSTMLLRRAALANILPLDHDLAAEDVQITFRLANQARFAYVDEPLVRRRMHSGNWGNAMGRLRWLETHAKTLQRLPRHAALTGLEKEAVDRLLLEYLEAAAYTAFTGGALLTARAYYGELIRRHYSNRAMIHWVASWLPDWAITTLRRVK